MRELRTALRERGGVAVIDLTGDVDGAAEAALDAAYDDAAARGAGSIALNFDAVDYINSTGVALVVALLAKARAARIDVRAFGLSDHYREIFEITRLSDFMAITDDEEHAVGSSDA